MGLSQRKIFDLFLKVKKYFDPRPKEELDGSVQTAETDHLRFRFPLEYRITVFDNESANELTQVDSIDREDRKIRAANDYTNWVFAQAFQCSWFVFSAKVLLNRRKLSVDAMTYIESDIFCSWSQGVLVIKFQRFPASPRQQTYLPEPEWVTRIFRIVVLAHSDDRMIDRDPVDWGRSTPTGLPVFL